MSILAPPPFSWLFVFCGSGSLLQHLSHCSIAVHWCGS
jgi:hypothetical protein